MLSCTASYYIQTLSLQPGIPINTTTPVPDLLDALGLHSGMAAGYRDFLLSLDNIAEVPRRVLNLCALRVAAIKGGTEPWLQRNPDHELSEVDVAALVKGEFAGFTGDEQAALSLTEKLPLAWHTLTDVEVAGVNAAFGARGTVALMSAIAYYDVNDRLEATLGSLTGRSNDKEG